MPSLSYARISDETVTKATKKGWKEWFTILEKAGARGWTHPEIVAYLKKKYKLTGWWQQGVTLGYEIFIGRRAEGRNAKGEHSLTATKTLTTTPKKLWALMNSEEGMAAWLQPMSQFTLKKGEQFEKEGGIFGEVRTVKPPIRARLTWQETDQLKPTLLQVYVVPKGDGKKTILVFYHEKIMSARMRDDLRAYWKAALGRLEKLL
jgi:uncharacterized protein YndB with AHSA1/START domain